uniref:Uncharacterized protein n=1 Tax=Anguilla anguilla TaxID=7936 RepID=A0A0E9WPN6_ANGAN
MHKVRKRPKKRRGEKKKEEKKTEKEQNALKSSSSIDHRNNQPLDRISLPARLQCCNNAIAHRQFKIKRETDAREAHTEDTAPP